MEKWWSHLSVWPPVRTSLITSMKVTWYDHSRRTSLDISIHSETCSRCVLSFTALVGFEHPGSNLSVLLQSNVLSDLVCPYRIGYWIIIKSTEFVQDQSLRDPSIYTDHIKDSLLKFDHLFSEFEFRYMTLTVRIVNWKSKKSFLIFARWFPT